ncbi:UNVERIFIED_CONTAM: hypothetical protein DES50_104135 [Williamsia faeni]
MNAAELRPIALLTATTSTPEAMSPDVKKLRRSWPIGSKGPERPGRRDQAFFTGVQTYV